MININEEKLREDLKKYVKETGVKYCFISKKLGIQNSRLSRWKNKKKNLPINQLVDLLNYIK